MKTNDQVAISVIVPVYNEEEILSSVMRELKEAMSSSSYGYEIIAVDDGSEDGSSKILDNIEGIRVIHNTANLGYGASLKRGIKEAKGEYILTIDADGTYPAQSIPSLINQMDQYDMVVGARTGKHVKIPFFRMPAKKFLSVLANFLSGRKIPDLNSGLRIFRKNIALEFFHLLPHGFSFTTTITLAALTNDYSVKFITIDYFKRKGKSSIHPIKDTVNFVSLIIRIIVYFRPLRFFIPISMLLFLSSIFVWAYGWFLFHTLFSSTIVILGVASIQIALFGLIADLIVRKR